MSTLANKIVGDMLMFDMGGEYACYGADISRSFPANGTMAAPITYMASLSLQESSRKASERYTRPCSLLRRP